VQVIICLDTGAGTSIGSAGEATAGFEAHQGAQQAGILPRAGHNPGGTAGAVFGTFVAQSTCQHTRAMGLDCWSEEDWQQATHREQRRFDTSMQQEPKDKEIRGSCVRACMGISSGREPELEGRGSRSRILC
jgi:hypothetical protein